MDIIPVECSKVPDGTDQEWERIMVLVRVRAPERAKLWKRTGVSRRNA